MKKLILSIGFFLFFTHAAHASANSVSSDCTSYAQKKYLIRGDWNSNQGSSRLWNFAKLTKTFTANNAGRCDSETFKQALDDSKEYWNYIKNKYRCPKEGVSQCDSSATNLGLLDIYQSIYGDKLSAVHTDSLYCDGGVPSISPTANNLSRQVAQILTNIAPKANSCEMVEDRIRKKDGEQISTNYIENSLSCVKKLVTGVLSNLKDLVMAVWDIAKLATSLTVKFGAQMVDFFKAAFKGTLTQFYAETSKNQNQFIQELAQSLISIPQAIQQGFEKEKQNFECLNSLGRTELICNTLGYVGSDIVLAVLTGGASKVAALEKISKLNQISHVAIAGAKVEKPLAIGSQEALKIGSEAAKAAKEAAEKAAKEAAEKAAKDASEKSAKGATEKVAKDPAREAANNIFSSQTRPSKMLENINIDQLTSQQAQELLKKISGASSPKEGFRSLRSKFHPDKFTNLNDKKISELANKESALVNRLWEKTGL